MDLGLRFRGAALVFGCKFGQVLAKRLIGLGLMASCALTTAQGLGGLGGYGGASLQGLNPQMPAIGLAGGAGAGYPAQLAPTVCDQTWAVERSCLIQRAGNPLGLPR